MNTLAPAIIALLSWKDRPGSPNRGRRVQFRIGLCCAIVSLFSSGLCVWAQNDDEEENDGNNPPIQFQVVVDPQFEFGEDASAGIRPAQDRDAESWLRRAAEAAQREDWKLVADTLERVVRYHGSGLIEAGDGTYQSAVRAAQRQIASLPPEGLQAYRIFFDPTAKRLLDRAKANYDVDALREIARVYPMTSQGPEAFDLLTAWLLDAVRPGEALAFLSQWSAMPRSRVTTEEIELRRALGYLLNRRPDQARSILDEIRGTGDAAIRERIALIESFLESGAPVVAQNGPGSQSWKTRLGPFATGLAEPLEPIVNEESRREALLPSKDPPNERVLREVALRQGRPPVWQVVSDGERLFVSCPLGLVALDAANMDILWQAFPKSRPRDRRIAEHRRMGMGIGLRAIIEDTGVEPEEGLDDQTTTTLFRESAGAVTVGHGLAFAIDQAVSDTETNPTRAGVPFPQFSMGLDGLLEGNSLMAYEADTGRLLWILGRGGPREHKLTDAHFFSTPIEYGDDFLVTYVRNGDLLLGVIDVDGNVVREVVIGAGQAELFPMYGVLEPTIADGSVYVPSGAGMLTALHEHDLSLRWFSTYDRSIRPISSGMRRGVLIMSEHRFEAHDEWLSTPPISVHGRVILAPQDANLLFVFDAEDGHLIWEVPRGKHRYVVGADDHRIVLAGETIEAIDLNDGKLLWAYKDDVLVRPDTPNEPLGSVDRMRPYGRPLMVGDRILVPTAGGMFTLDAATGEVIGDPAGEGLAFGNLRAFDGALYSVGHSSISKYPDPVRAQNLAMDRLERNPGDIQAMLRLAWLAILRSDWDGSLEWLDEADRAIAEQVASIPGDAESERVAMMEAKDRVSHHRVTVLLAMADDRDDTERAELLDQAFRAARLSADRANAGLSLAMQQFSMGRELEAAQLCVNLLESSRGQPIEINARWRVQDSIEIGRRLGHLLDRSAPSVRDEITAMLADVGDRMRAANDTAGLARITDAIGFLPISVDFDLALAAIDCNRGYVESAVYHLNRGMSRSADDSVAPSVLVRLANLHTTPPAGYAPNLVEARRAIERLSGLDDATAMPSDVADIATATGARTIGEFVEWCTAQLPGNDATATPFILREGARLALMSEAFVRNTDNPDVAESGVLSFYDLNRPFELDDRVIPFFLSDQYRGLEPAPLDAAPHRWVHHPDRVGVSYEGDDRIATRPCDMAIAGRMAVMARPTQVDAVGLDSGRAMWMPIPVASHLGDMPEPSVVTDGMVVIAATDPGTLVAASARDGAEPLWRRSWPDRRLGRLYVVDGRLICIDAVDHRAAVIDMETGQLEREFVLPIGQESTAAAGDDNHSDVPSNDQSSNRRLLARVGSFLFRATGEHVVARRATTGEVVWESDVEGDILGLGELDGEHLAIYHDDNSVRVVSAADGAVVLTVKADGLEMPPMDAVIDRPRDSERPRLLIFARMDDEVTTEFVLRSFPLEQGAQPWSAELGTFATVGPQMLRASPDYVAVVTNKTKDAQGFDGTRKRLMIDTKVPPKLYVISKSNGRRVGPAPYMFYDGQLGTEGSSPNPLMTPGSTSPLHRSRLISDVVILDRRIIAFAPEGCYVLADQTEVEDKE